LCKSAAASFCGTIPAHKKTAAKPGGLAAS
jgi:hypothetical protein